MLLITWTDAQNNIDRQTKRWAHGRTGRHLTVRDSQMDRKKGRQIYKHSHKKIGVRVRARAFAERKRGGKELKERDRNRRRRRSRMVVE